MKWSIITDSSCDFLTDVKLSTKIIFGKVPFIISIDKTDYVDNDSLNVSEMLDHMEAFKEVSHTSCPSPYAWYERFAESDCTIAITISSNLSGSYNSAMTARNMIFEDNPKKKIFVLDSQSAGSALAMYVEKAIELIEKSTEFDTIVSELQEFANGKHTIFALSSFSNLVKNGRMSKLAGAIAGKLGIWGLGIASKEGKIVMKEKVRGKNNVVSGFIKDMKENGFCCGSVIISHCQNSELAEKLRDRIFETWNDVKVEVLPVRGLCSYYAERKGLIVAY